MNVMQTGTARRFAYFLSILLATTPLAAVAQDRTFPAGTITLQRDPNDPSTLLNRHLRTLSSNPRDMEALLGAGRAALAMGDANAAIGFFGRAEAVSPNNGRVKAGLGAAAVQQEQPRQALVLFDAAIAAGVPVAEIGTDRGLAYDLRGQTRLAQADYRAVLAARRDDETLRRLALSQAIGGDRLGAMTTLDPLLRQQDKAAWRAATFVLAMTGDPTGAVRRANQLMIPTQAAAMTPYLQRLGGLNAAEKAAAVHFGRFPAASSRSRTQVAAAAAPAATARAQAVGRALTPTGAALGTPVNTTVSNPQVAAAAVSARPVAATAVTPLPAERPVVAMVTGAGSSAASLNRQALAAAPATVSAAPAVTPTAAVPAPASEPVGTSAAALNRQALVASPTVPAPTPVATVPATAPTGEARAPVAGPPAPQAAPPVQTATAVQAIPTPTAPAATQLADASLAPVLPADTVRMTTAVPTRAPATPAPAAPVAAKPVPVVAVAAPKPAGPVLTAAEKTLLGIRTRAAVPVASLTRAQKAKLAAPAATEAVVADAGESATLSVAEKTLLGLRRTRVVARSSLTRGQAATLAAAAAKADVPAADADESATLSVAEKTLLGLRRTRIVTRSSLTRGQAATLAAAAKADAPAEVLTADQKTLLGIKTRGDVAVSTLTRAQKAKLAAKPDADLVMLTADEKKTLGIKTRGDVAVSTLTRAQKAKLAAKPDADVATLTAAEKKTLGIKTRGDVAVSTLTRAQKARLASADTPDAKAGKTKTAARYWLQVAGGANKATLPKDYAGIQNRYRALLKGRGAWTTPLRFTNRILVGPFASDGEAQAFVNKAGGAGLNAFTYTSPAGVVVEKVPAR